jgi:hypothetical protein
MAAARSIPRSAYDVAMKNTGFLNAMAAVYAADGRCRDAEGFLERSLSLDKETGRRPDEGTELQLTGLWMREQEFGKAGRGYRQVIDNNARSADGWRGYITALHNSKDDRTVVAEARRIPAETRAALQKDPSFLVLFASAYSKVGQDGEAAGLFAQARASYRSQGRVPPADLDVQLGWALLAAPQGQADLQNLLAEARTRTDLSPEQREAFGKMRSLWSVRSAEAALKTQGAARAIAILADAERELPKNPRIRAAVAGIYLQEHEYENVLAVYQSWGMAGADAGEYRSAAGAAIAARQTALADAYLLEGREHWPQDAELLRMSGRQAVAEGRYKDGERFLKSALGATGSPERNAPTVAQEVAAAEQTTPITPPNACRLDTTTNDPGPTPVATAPRGQSTRTEHGPSASNDPQESPAEPDRPQSTDRNQDGESSQARDEIDLVQHRNTPLVDVGVPVTIRAGDPGLDRLTVADGVVGGSVAIENTVRIIANAHVVSLWSGIPDGRSGYRFGTLPAGARFAEQTATGRSGEIQVSSDDVGLTFGVSPKGFLTDTWTAGVRLGKVDAPIRLVAVRDNIKDSLLSYAGARDPVTGAVWGGVVSNSISLQLGRYGSSSGQYISATGALIRGQNVINNWDVEGSVGAYRSLATAGQGALSVGVNTSGMHYDRNSNFFSLGHGGYFSPQQYVVASVPITWTGRLSRVAYEINASAGYQYVVEDAAPYYPIQAILNQIYYDASKQNGLNYNAALRLDYHVAAHWHVGSFASVNNAHDYQRMSFGVTLTFLTQRLPTDTGLHPRPVPDWRGTPPFKF